MLLLHSNRCSHAELLIPVDAALLLDVYELEREPLDRNVSGRVASIAPRYHVVVPVLVLVVNEVACASGPRSACV